MLIPVAVVNETADVAIGSTSGLLQWYAADQEVGRTDGDPITSVTDRSGNGNTLTGGTGPQWRNAANGIGGHPAYEFASGREVSGSGRILPLNDLTVFIVMTYSSGRPFGAENDTDGNHGFALFNNLNWIIRRSGANFDVSTASASPIVHSCRIGGGLANAMGNYEGSGRSDLGASGYSDAGVNFTLGSSGNGASDLSGKIAEFISFNRYLTQNEYYGIFTQLGEKYGIL